MAKIDKDWTFDEIWDKLLSANVLTDDEMQYLDNMHQKALGGTNEL